MTALAHPTTSVTPIYPECAPPSPPTIVISGVAPSVFEELGGTELLITGTFPVLVPLGVFVGTLGDETDASCYGGQGFGYLPMSLDGVMVRVVSPQTVPGNLLLSIHAAGFVSGTFPVTVVERVHRGKVFASRLLFPSWAAVGARRIDG